MDTETVADVIRLLIGHRKPSYPDEAPVCLYLLQVWIQFPDSEDMVNTAGIQLCNRILALAERRLARQNQRPTGTAQVLRSLLADPSNARLYDDLIGKHGGWMRVRKEDDFDKRMNIRYAENEAVADMIDYRFRYLDHSRNPDSRTANISHAQVYRWRATKPGASVAGKAIRTRWATSKTSAVFIYANYRLRQCMCPALLFPRDPLRNLREQASDTALMQRYFGVCAYVAEKLNEYGKNDQSEDYYPNGEILKRIRPRTARVSDVDLEKLKSTYTKDYRLLRGN